MWIQNYLPTEHGVRWRTPEDGLPPARRCICSPYDPEAHYAVKRTSSWVGYTVHLTETCAPDTPHLITDVATTLAPASDWEATPTVHAALARRALLPNEHLVDLGYIDADLLVASRRDYGVELLGPVRPDAKWQALEKTGFAAEFFSIDWERQQATCPAGRTSVSWTPVVDNRRTEVIKIRFSEKDCWRCPQVQRCVRSSKKYPAA